MPATVITLTSRALSIYDQPDETPIVASCRPRTQAKMSAHEVDDALSQFAKFNSQWMNGGRLCRTVFAKTHGQEFAQELGLWYARLLRITMGEARRFEADQPVYLREIFEGLDAIYDGNRAIINQGKSRPAEATTFLRQRNAFHRRGDDQDNDCIHHQPFVDRFRDVRFRLDICADIDEGLQHLGELDSLHRNAALGRHRTCHRAMAAGRWHSPQPLNNGLKDMMDALADVQLD